MSLRKAILIMSAISSNAVAAATDRLVQAPLPGFKIGYRASKDGSSIEEKVPSGESVERWTRMVTTQRFAGVAQRLSAAQLLQNMADGLRTGCPGGTTTPIVRLTVSGRPAADLRADCPRNPATGLRETFIARVISGATDLHIVQVAFRFAPSASDVKWARAHLASLTLQ